MPISTPAYWPPPRGTDQIVGITAGRAQTGARVILGGQNAGNNSTISDFIALGNEAGAAGLTAAKFDGTTLIGSQAFKSLTAQADAQGAVTALGYNICPLLTTASTMVAIGSNILQNLVSLEFTNPSNVVVIGHNILPGFTTLATSNNFKENVIIGCAIGGSNLTGTFEGCVVIGTSIPANTADPNAQPLDSVVIGWSAGNAVGDQNVAIGSQAAGDYTTGTGNISIGYNSGNGIATTSSNIYLGSFSGLGYLEIGERLLIAPGTAYSNESLIDGNGANGNICLGLSSDANSGVQLAGANNILKLMNGTASAAVPTAGGYFYVTAGVLHFVDGAGNITTLSSINGQLAASTTQAYTNNSSSNVGTISNAPTAGNPTKWIPINDNGTIRNIPAW